MLAKIFTTSNGVSPLYGKYTKPIIQIKYSPTVYSVKSDGFKCEWYKNVKNSSDGWTSTNLAYTGYIPLVSFWYGQGLPEVFTDVQDMKSYGIKITGQFYNEYGNGTYRFYFGGEGYIYCSTEGILISEKSMHLNDQYYHSADATISSEWTNLEIKYWTTISEGRQTGFTALWKSSPTSTADMPHQIPLSAGICASPGATAFTTSYAIASIVEPITLNISQKEPAKLIFKVPLASSANDFRGFKYNDSGDYYEDMEDSNIKLKKWRMIEYYEGYKTSGGSNELIQKFRGQIRNFDIDLNPGSGDILIIECYDYSIFARDAINIYSPTPIDYIMAGYLTEYTNRVNGQVKPYCYDGWELYKMYENLLINSYIDPILLIKKKRFINYSDVEVDGGYNIQELNWVTTTNPNINTIWLARQNYYGNIGEVIDIGTIPDKEYVWSLDVGEYYQDMINTVSDEYGLQWGMDNRGYVYLKTIDTFTNYIDDRDTASGQFTYNGTWSTSNISSSVYPIDAFKATYSYATSNNCSAYCTFTGKKAQFLIGVGPNCVPETSDGYGIYVRIERGATAFSANEYNLYYSTHRHYYTGVDNTTGLNPTIINISGLNYDTYTAYICKTTSAGVLRLDGLLVCDEDYDVAQVTFKSGDNISTPGSIIDLGIENPTESIRNECIVLGSLLGNKLGTNRESVINPNNPVFIYVQSASKDINSIYDPSSENYVGRPLVTIIQDPGLITQEQADYLSYNFLESYRRAGKEVSLRTLGHPLIELNDCLYVVDVAKDSINATQKVWVTGIENDFGNTYTTNLQVSPYKPIKSYMQKPQPDLTLFDNEPIQNLRLYNAGSLMSLYTAIDGYATEINAYSDETNYKEKIPQKGYLIFTDGGESITERCFYGSIDTSNASYVQFKEVHRDNDVGGDARVHAKNTFVGCIWDPYQYDYTGIAPMLLFDLLNNTKLEGKVYAISESSRNFHIDTLTGIGTDNWPGIEGKFSYNEYDWGKNKVLIWGGLDSQGFWNKKFPYDDDNFGANYFITEEVIQDILKNYQKSNIKLISEDIDKIRKNIISPYIITKRRDKLQMESWFKGQYYKVPNALNQQEVTQQFSGLPDIKSDNFKVDAGYFKNTDNDNRGIKYAVRTKHTNILLKEPNFTNYYSLITTMYGYCFSYLMYRYYDTEKEAYYIQGLKEGNLVVYTFKPCEHTTIDLDLYNNNYGNNLYFNPYNSSPQEEGFDFVPIPTSEYAKNNATGNINTLGIWWHFVRKLQVVDKSGRMVYWTDVNIDPTISFTFYGPYISWKDPNYSTHQHYIIAGWSGGLWNNQFPAPYYKYPMFIDLI